MQHLFKDKSYVESLFKIAGIPVTRMWKIPNQYWPEAYLTQYDIPPWWLVRTPLGLIEIGWRKRVISIDWSDTPTRHIVTPDDVTKGDTYVHAWGELKAIEYLKILGAQYNVFS